MPSAEGLTFYNIKLNRINSHSKFKIRLHYLTLYFHKGPVVLQFHEV